MRGEVRIHEEIMENFPGDVLELVRKDYFWNKKKLNQKFEGFAECAQILPNQNIKPGTQSEGKKWKNRGIRILH